MKRNRIYVGVVIIVLLITAFFCGEKTHELKETQKPDIQAVSDKLIIQPAPEISQSPEPVSVIEVTASPKTMATVTQNPDEDKKSTSESILAPKSVPSAEPTPTVEIIKQTEETPHKDELTCSLSVSCAEVLDNMDKLTEGKAELIPKDGIIYPEQTVVFYDGESVFNVLLREMKKNKIHLEFVDTPMYNSTYIEGIGNLYEFDCSEVSGWRYKVNGEFMNYSCSKHEICDGDKIEWVYTCDWKRDFEEYKGE